MLNLIVFGNEPNNAKLSLLLRDTGFVRHVIQYDEKTLGNNHDLKIYTLTHTSKILLRLP